MIKSRQSKPRTPALGAPDSGRQDGDLDAAGDCQEAARQDLVGGAMGASGDGSEPADEDGLFGLLAILEKRFDEDLSGMTLFTGQTAPLGMEGASGAASGDTIATASAAPTIENVAHEVVHYLQQQNGAAPDRAVSAPEDDAEKEADRVASRVASGLPAGPITAAPSARHMRKIESGGPDPQGDASKLAGLLHQWDTPEDAVLDLLKQHALYSTAGALRAAYDAGGADLYVDLEAALDATQMAAARAYLGSSVDFDEVVDSRKGTVNDDEAGL